MTQLKPLVNSRDHVYGNTNAVLELVEYGDYQCPYCGRAYPIIKRLQKKIGEDLRFVFRNFPIRKVHPLAVAAAIATEAAGMQGKFWEMHDAVFENQVKLTEHFILSLAARIGLDLEQFEEDIHLPELREKVDQDFESGLRSGVNRTPSFFINGEKYEGSWEEDDFLEHLEGLLKNHRNTVTDAHWKII